MSTTRHLISKDEAQGPFFVGADLGGTNFKVGVVDDSGQILSWHRVATEADKGPADGVRRMGQAVLKAIAEAGLNPSEIARVGLGTPGTMDIPAGMLLDPPNLQGWNDFPIRDRLRDECGLPVSFANDANSAAFGEYWIGRGREFHSMLLLTLGTGVGGGIVIGDLSIDGEHSHGSECGHIIIDYADDARMCGCGQSGHLEAYAGGWAIVERTMEALDRGVTSSLRKRLESDGQITPLVLAEEAEQGDEIANRIIMETAAFLGVGIVSLVHTIDPDGVLLGGAMRFGGHETALGRCFLERIREEVHRRAFPVLAEKTTIDYASLGGDAGFIGAAGIARVAHREGRQD